MSPPFIVVMKYCRNIFAFDISIFWQKAKKDKRPSMCTFRILPFRDLNKPRFVYFLHEYQIKGTEQLNKLNKIYFKSGSELLHMFLSNWFFMVHQHRYKF